MLDAYRDLIDDLIDTPTAVKRVALTPASAARLRELIDADILALDHLQRLTREQNAVLSAPPAPVDGQLVPMADPDAVAAPEPDADPAEIAAAFDTARGELVSLLINLTLKHWEATGIDVDGQEISVADLVERHVELDEHVRADLGV